jgi:hypothetical protein
MISFRFNPDRSGLDLFVILITLVQHFILKYNDQIKFRTNQFCQD